MPKDPHSPKIYLWPNLMTAGNLLCGFFAIMNIVTYRIKGTTEDFNPTLAYHYYWAIGLILGACLFDALDGRIARMVGEESPCGRDFDSLADGVSFFMDADSGHYLHDCEVDYVDTLADRGFKIHNPNAVRSCGCGSSFEPAAAGAVQPAPPVPDGQACGEAA